ncbi:MAG: ABC transporter permease [Planctomycetota bacterium]|jgi:putative ABC transport system permease protein
MNLVTLVGREIFERKSQLATSFVAVLLGITVIVSIKNTTYYSEMAVASELDALGANVLILPKSATVQDYYGADLQGEEFPEAYVTRLALSDLEGVDNISPKLSVPVKLERGRLTLTGILPRSEFKAKAAWRGAGVFARPAEGCGTVAESTAPAAPNGGRSRVIETLAANEALLGADAAAILGRGEGDTVEVLGKPLSVVAVLPETGTVDDTRIFAHLHTVQKLAGTGKAVNAIEIIGCCKEISAGLVQKINALLPEARVVTVAQTVETQIRTNRMMARLSMIFLGIIVLVGGASIANYMYANVYERRREIGTLMAVGAGSSLVLRIFLLKAVLLGLAGGIGGFVVGTVLAVTLGPEVAGVPVLPMPGLIFWAVGISVAMAVAASYFPARRASRLDPCTTLQEI